MIAWCVCISKLITDWCSSGGSRIFQRGRQHLEGAPTYYLANFSRKLHGNEEILARGRPLCLLDPLMCRLIHAATKGYGKIMFSVCLFTGGYPLVCGLKSFPGRSFPCVTPILSRGIPLPPPPTVRGVPLAA